MTERNRDGLGLKVENGREKELGGSRSYHEVEFPGGGSVWFLKIDNSSTKYTSGEMGIKGLEDPGSVPDS